jgi:MoaA/NifB/PqqE/SkfB family radical SAM enzyme
MDMATYRAVAAAFPQLRQVYIDAWGEPLLHPHLWEMVAIARAAGCSVGITTNGTLIDEDVARRLAGEVDVVGISVDGATAATYESIRRGARFERVVAGVRALIAARDRRAQGLPLVSLLFLKNRRNLHELPAMVRFAGELGADEVIASNLTYVARPEFESMRAHTLGSPGADDLAILDRARQEARSLGLGLRIYPLAPRRVAFCEARPLDSLHVTWDGFITPCVYLTLPVRTGSIAKVHEGEVLRLPVTRLGNVKEAGLTEIWDSPAYREFRAPFAERSAICAGKSFGILDDGGFEELDEGTFEAVGQRPLPGACRGCYKALGI